METPTMPTPESLYAEWRAKLPDSDTTKLLVTALYTQVADSKPAGARLALGTLIKFATWHACTTTAERLAVAAHFHK